MYTEMAVKCPMCRKGSRMVTSRVLLRGHYNPTGKSRKKPNLQWAKVGAERMKICTDCIKTLNRSAKTV
jgi:ribosomal protein L28